MDQQTIDEIAKLRADIEVNQMVLGQLLGFIAMNLPQPREAINSMHEKLVERLGKLPNNALVALTRAKLDQFFATMHRSLDQMAGDPGSQRSH